MKNQKQNRWIEFLLPFFKLLTFLSHRSCSSVPMSNEVEKRNQICRRVQKQTKGNCRKFADMLYSYRLQYLTPLFRFRHYRLARTVGLQQIEAIMDHG